MTLTEALVTLLDPRRGPAKRYDLIEMALSLQPVNQHLGPASTVPIGVFAKANPYRDES